MQGKKINYRMSILKFQRVPLLMLMLFLSGCVERTTTNSCPVWPEPNIKAADELEKYCYPEGKCPSVWEWVNRLYVLKDQLKICRKPVEGN